MELLLEGSKSKIGGRGEKKRKSKKKKWRTSKNRGRGKQKAREEKAWKDARKGSVSQMCPRYSGEDAIGWPGTPHKVYMPKLPRFSCRWSHRLDKNNYITGCVSVTLLTAAQALPDTQQKLTNNWLWIRTRFLTLKPVRFKVRTSIRLPPGHLAFSKIPVNILRTIFLPVYFVIQQMTLNDF